MRDREEDRVAKLVTTAAGGKVGKRSNTMTQPVYHRKEIFEDEQKLPPASSPLDSGLEDLNCCFKAATYSLNFDIAEIWHLPREGSIQTAEKTEAIGIKALESKSTSTVTTAEVGLGLLEPVCVHVYKMNANVDMYRARRAGLWNRGYENSKASRDHILSPGLCKQARVSECPLWFTSTDSRPLHPALNLKTAVVLPVHLDSTTEFDDHSEGSKSGEYFTVFLSLELLERNMAALEFFGHVSKAATTLYLKHLANAARSLTESQENLGRQTSEHVTSQTSSELIKVQGQQVVAQHGGRPSSEMVWSDLSNVEFLVNGGRCAVYTAIYKDQQRVVVKLARKDLHYAATVRKELDQELDLMLRIRHENIVRLIGAGEEPEHFLVLARYDGGTLTQRCGLATNQIRDTQGRFKDKKPFEYIELLRCARQLSEALRYLHEEAIPGKMVIHRDVKPDNICFNAEGVLKLLDLSLSKIVAKSETDNAVYTLTGEAGSARYMAPEVAESRAYNEKVDVYSYGLVLWQMATLEKPFAAMPHDQLIRDVTRGSHRPRIDSEWPRALSDLMQSCWSEDPIKRPSFERVGGLLQGMLQETIDQKRHEMPVPKTKPGFRRRLLHSSWF